MKRYITAAAVALATLTVSADKVRTVFSIDPPMSCQNCENNIKGNIRFEKGIKDIRTSLRDQTVTVTYDPAKTTPEAIHEAFAKLGYEIIPVPEEEKTSETDASTGASHRN